MSDARIDRAIRRYELAAFGGDPSELDLADRDLDGVEADLALARGRIRHARHLTRRAAGAAPPAAAEAAAELGDFQRAARLYRTLDDVEGHALASFWVGCFHQVVRDDGASALPALTTAYRDGSPSTRSYAARHLGFHALAAGEAQRAGELLEESLRLRREHGSPAEVAAALLAVAEHRASTGREAEAHRLLGDAERTARAAGAAGVVRWVAATRDELSARVLRPRYPVRTARLLLRPLTTADAASLLAYRGRADVCRYVPFEPMTAEDITARLAGSWSSTALTDEGQNLTLGIELADSGRLVGDVVLFWHSREHGHGELGWVLDPDFGGHGYATEAVRELLRLGFEELGLRRLTARVDERNTSSARLAERLGMRLEARLVENEIFKGEPSTELDFAMLATEWPSHRLT